MTLREYSAALRHHGFNRVPGFIFGPLTKKSSHAHYHYSADDGWEPRFFFDIQNALSKRAELLEKQARRLLRDTPLTPIQDCLYGRKITLQKP